MANPYVNKVAINGVTKIDLTGDNVTANDVRKGIRFHAPSGAIQTGAFNLDNITEIAAGSFTLSAEKTSGNYEIPLSLSHDPTFAVLYATTIKKRVRGVVSSLAFVDSTGNVGSIGMGISASDGFYGNDEIYFNKNDVSSGNGLIVGMTRTKLVIQAASQYRALRANEVYHWMVVCRG